MNAASRLTVGAVVLLFLAAGAGAQNETSQIRHPEAKEVPIAMYEFLHDWLVEHDRSKTLSYFSTSRRAMQLAPDRVWKAGGNEVGRGVAAYRDGTWELINSVWRVRGGARLGDALRPVSGELMQAFGQELGVDVVSRAEKDPFLVYVASSDVSIYNFDGAHKDAVSVLKPKERTTLGMLADVVRSDDAEGAVSQNAGPFVSFWQEEPEGWRIQMVGAVLP